MFILVFVEGYKFFLFYKNFGRCNLEYTNLALVPYKKKYFKAFAIFLKTEPTVYNAI